VARIDHLVGDKVLTCVSSLPSLTKIAHPILSLSNHPEGTVTDCAEQHGLDGVPGLGHDSGSPLRSLLWPASHHHGLYRSAECTTSKRTSAKVVFVFWTISYGYFSLFPSLLRDCVELYSIYKKEKICEIQIRQC
jgi:hypothetical protein